MNNPFFGALASGNNFMQMMRQFQQFKANFHGDPKAEVEKLLQSVKLNQQNSSMLSEQLTSGETDICLCSTMNEPDTAWMYLWSEEMFLVVPEDHPLAQKSVLQRSDLADLPEIVHGDTFRQSGQPDQHVSRKIYTVDRLAQLSLLEKLPNSYMGASAMPERCLRRWGFVQKICSDNQIVYHDAIAFNAQYNMSEIETELLEYIFSRYHR